MNGEDLGDCDPTAEAPPEAIRSPLEVVYSMDFMVMVLEKP